MLIMTKKEIFGKNVRRLRRGLDLTQTELGVEVNRNFQWVAAIEHGRTNPVGEDIIQLAKALGTTAEQLYAEIPT